MQGWSEVEGRDRQLLARQVFGWAMEDAGGLTEGLTLEAREALGAIGLDTLIGLLRPVLDERQKTRRAELGEGDGEATDPLAARVRRVLREASEARGDLDAFIEYCAADGSSGEDVLAAVRHLEREGRTEEALLWADRGRRKARGSVRATLEDTRIQLLTRLGRRREAIEAAWEGFRREPGGAAYRRLLGVVAEEERGEWRRRALDQAESGSDATAFVDVCIASAESERLAHRLDSAPAFVLAASSTVLERAADFLDGKVSRASARLCLHLASQLLGEGDARHYARVRALLERGRQAFVADGSESAWSEGLARIRDAHAVVRAWYP